MGPEERSKLKTANEAHAFARSQPRAETFDVIVVGAGLAGCTAARLFALEGLRVGLVDANRDMRTFKQLCTHFIQASATPTLRRMGLDRLIEGAGGVRNGVDIWTRYGWTGDAPPLAADGNPAFGYNIQRRTLDPILRQLTVDTPGVTYLPSSKVRKVIEHGVAIKVAMANSSILEAKLLVGADGRNSAIARLMGIKAASSENCRFGAFRSYLKVPLRRGFCSQMWLRGPEAGCLFPNNDGVTVIGYMTTKDRLDNFLGNANQALERRMGLFPDCPDLVGAEPLGNTLLVRDYPNLWRRPVKGNVAFVGDALMSIDPLWGVGCGFAFQAAEWLVNALAPALRRGQPAARALRTYATRVFWQFGGHRFFINDYARRHDFNALERLAFSAAAKDQEFAQLLHAFGARMIGPSRLLSPANILRAVWINLRNPLEVAARRDSRP
jgi:menaquinone-9 beta-reductase